MPPVVKIVGRVVATLVIAAALIATILPRYLDRIYHRGSPSGHFDGARFFNPDGDADTATPPGPGGRSGFLWRQLTGSDDRPAWPATVTVASAKPAARVTGDRMIATWVGHATVLVQTAGLNILTDPVWADSAGPFGMGPRRVAAPGIAFADLPPIDLVVVSHNHYDHMDLATLKRLWDRDHPAIVTSLGNDAVIRGAGIPPIAAPSDGCGDCRGVQALDWREQTVIGGGRAMAAWSARPTGAAPIARVSVVRNHHWGSRWFADRNRALWSAFVIDTPAGSIFFAGDTGLGDDRWPAEARAAVLHPIRLALIPIGAFRFTPHQMASGSHIGPPQAVEVFAGLGAATAIPVHWGTFRLSYEGYDTPPRLLAATMRCAGVAANRFAAVPIGRPVAIPAAGAAPVAVDPAAVARCLDTPAVRALE